MGKFEGPKSEGFSSVDTRENDVGYWLSGIAAIPDPAWSQDAFPYAEVAEVLHNISIGMPVRLASEAVGVLEATFTRYRQIEPRLNALVTMARAKATRPAVEKIMGSNDWRAAAWLLERNLAREEYKEEARGPEKLVIEINVSRDASAAQGIIDITPEGSDAAVVASLPAQRKAEDFSRG